MTAVPAAVSCPPPYRRRRPERTLLYRTVQTHFETWLALTRDGAVDGDPVPVHVEREFRRYLTCGKDSKSNAPRRDREQGSRAPHDEVGAWTRGRASLRDGCFARVRFLASVRGRAARAG